MELLTLASDIKRRKLLTAGIGAVGLYLTGRATKASAQEPASQNAGFDKIQQIIDVKGNVKHGLLHLEIDRNDMTNVTLHGIPITPDFQLNGDIYFQPHGNDQVVLNADLPLKASELNPFIQQLVSNDIAVQAEHQHFYDFSPEVWFVHFRAQGPPEKVAHGLKSALSVTSAPFPQKPPKNPTSPLPHEQIGKTLGVDADLGDHGVVNLNVPRQEVITLAGTQISPYLNVATQIAFQPHGANEAAAVVDFAMIASEINNVLSVMLKQGWDIGCLYNQETDEHPQLFFSHQFKTGDAIQLAKEMRKGLEQTNSKL